MSIFNVFVGRPSLSQRHYSVIHLSHTFLELGVFEGKEFTWHNGLLLQSRNVITSISLLPFNVHYGLTKEGQADPLPRLRLTANSWWASGHSCPFETSTAKSSLGFWVCSFTQHNRSDFHNCVEGLHMCEMITNTRITVLCFTEPHDGGLS